MSNYLTVTSISYAPINGTDEEVMVQVHKDLPELVDRAARATRPDLVVLPETICRTCDEEVPEGPTSRLLADLARQHGCYITVPVHQQDSKSGAIFNVLGLLDRKGDLAGIYRKYVPVFPEFDHGTRPGPGAILIQTEFGPVGGVICFDLNFAELRAQYKELKPKLLLFSSMYHGGVVQNFWALDVQAFFVGSVYQGTPCTIIDPQGTTLAESNNYQPWATARINLDYEVVHLDKNQARYDDIQRQYGEAVRIVTAGQVGTSVIYSESDERTAADIVDEFELVRLEEYFDWSRDLRQQHIEGIRP
ncbi:MAG: hypothetical protein GKR89_34165 [Candidatus Latescibacteria bacterium]|nr:hypothetical protein [Candidatus Latescibacterota bacterium]